TVVTPVGTAASPPLFHMTFGASGSLAQVTNSVVGVNDLAYQLLFSGAQPPAATQLQIDCARLMVVPGSYLSLLRPGSTFGSFRLVGGVENELTVSGASLTDLRYSYAPRFWSWEDADVA